MDPLTTSIVAAITAGAVRGTTDIAKKSIADGYDAIEGLIKKKFGGNSQVLDAMDKLQAKPDSAGRRETLAEEIKEIKAAEEPELLAAAGSLLELIQAMPNGEQHIHQAAQGTGIAQASGGSTANVNIFAPTGSKNDV
jgi:hypothetical protein